MLRSSAARVLLVGFVTACGGAAPATTGGASGSASVGGNAAGGGTGSAGTTTTASGSAGASAGTERSGAGGVSSGSANGANASAGAETGGAPTGGTSGSGGQASGETQPKRVLLYHFSTLAIESVPAQLMLLRTQLQTWGYEVEDSVSPADLSAVNLARFGAVGMINTCFEPFGADQPGTTQAAALAAFVEQGGGLFGIHCAAVTFQSAEPPHAYNAVIGGRGGHGFFDGKSACRTMKDHVTTAMLPATFDFSGNLDNADYVAPDSQVLVKCQWSGGDKKDTAVSWVRTPGKGRVFYTNFAKVDADLIDATLGQKHIWLGLGWVLGH